MKGMADALGDLGEVITDCTLVLNVLRGLNAKYDHMKALLKRTRPFLTFNEVRNDLQLEELMLDPPVSQPPTALLASQPKSSATNTSQVPQPGGPSLHGASNRAPGTGPSHHGAGAGSGSNGGKRHRRRGNSGKGGNSSQGGSPWPSFYNPWTGSFTVWPTRGQQQQPHGPPPDGGSGHPTPQQAFMAAPNPYGIPPPPGFPPMLTAPAFSMNQQQYHQQQPQQQVYQAPSQSPWTGSWNQQALANSFSTMSLTPPAVTDWVMDSGASNHMTPDAGNISPFRPPHFTCPSSIVVGNGSTLPVTATGDAVLPGTFRLNNVLVAPNIIKNLISVRQFTTYNNCSVEFDPFDLSVKDLHSRNEIIRCNSSGPLYSLMPPAASSSSCALIAAAPAAVWHRRLGHPGHEALFKLSSVSAISCIHHSSDQLCHACQLGRHIRLPFANSSSRALKNFDLIHCDLWTSPIKSVSRYKYYLVILDDHSHFLWTFPLRLKSETFSTLANFFSYVTT